MVYHKRNKQGFWVSMFFEKGDIVIDDDVRKSYKVINVALRVGISKRHNEEWFAKGETGDGITGNGDVSNLKIALDLLKKFILKNPKENILVGAEDDRRFRAYTWLKRYGFIELCDDCSGEKVLFKRGELNERN